MPFDSKLARVVIAYIREGRESANRRVGVLFRDITTRQRKEQEFRRNQQRADTALSIAKLGSFEWDLRTNRMQCSQRARDIFDFSVDEGCCPEDYFGRVLPEDLARVQFEFAAALAGGGRLHVNYPIRLPDGSIRIFESVGVSYQNERW